MTPPAWRPVLAAAIAFLTPLAVHATEAQGTPPASRASYSLGDPPSKPTSPDPSNPSPTPAASPSPSASPSRPPTADIDALGRSLGYLTLFAAVAGAAIYFVKFGLPLARKSAAAERKLQVLETRPLGNRQYLIVVAYDDTRMLLGITPGKIDYLCPLDSQSAPKDFGAMMASMEKNTPPA